MMTTTLKRVLGALVLVLALVGAAFIGSTVYRVGQLVLLLDAADLAFLHQARVNMQQQAQAPPAKPPAPAPPKPAESPAP